MKTYSVTFLPENRTVQAAAGKSLLDAAVAAGVSIANVCGGDGVCGKCRVIVKSGKVTAAPDMFLTRLDIQRGVALACRTYVDGDVLVEVPPESLISQVPQLASEDAVRFGKISEWIGEGRQFPAAPLATKEFLTLPTPSLDDALSDEDRLYRELRRRAELPVMQTGLAVLRRLPTLLRENGFQITALLGERNGTTEVVDIEPGNTAGRNFGVAIDIGTTTVVAHLIDLNSGDTLATKAKYNSQARLGEDVITRIMYATSTARCGELHELIVEDINGLIAALAVESDVRLNDISYVLCAGNTAMTHLLFGLDPTHIRRDPYIPCATQPPAIRAAEVGVHIHGRGLLATVPCVASYVGGDIVADVLVSGMTESSDVSLLLDLGTNGELVLGSADWLMCCSASAGPAFEGGGITCGMRATSGAIERITLKPGGVVEAIDVVGGGKPVGLCGSGLIDVVGELLRVGCIDRRGRFIPDACAGRVREDDSGAPEFVLIPGEQTRLGRDIILSEADISNFIHTKGSIYMAADCLLEHMGLTFNDVARVYIAGGFGNYVRIPQAISIGLLPDIPHDRFRFIGNGSVQGAKMALLSRHALQYTRDRIATAMTNIDLSSNHKYMNEYSSCLFLPHTNVEKFPSVHAQMTANSAGNAS